MSEWMMSTEKIRTGDVVYLNSGSPALKVVYVTRTECAVMWFDGAVEKRMGLPLSCVTKKSPDGRRHLHVVGK